MFCIYRVCVYLLKLKLCEFILCQRRTQPKRSSIKSCLGCLWQRGNRFNVLLSPCNCCVISCSLRGHFACDKVHIVAIHFVWCCQARMAMASPIMMIAQFDVFRESQRSATYDLSWSVFVNHVWVTCNSERPCSSSILIWCFLLVHPCTSIPLE